MGELDCRLDGAAGGMMGDPDDLYPPSSDREPISRRGDVWRLGPHCVVCGDALKADTYSAALGDEKAAMVFTDPPYNVPIAGHVSGLGTVRHREFAMASGEMSEAEFKGFLAGMMTHAAAFSADGSIHFHFIDWRHLRTLLEAGDGIYSELKNLCIWVKSNAGMGSLYRSQHELVTVFKKGSAPHCNNVELGKHGRHRSNVWEYPGANSFSPTRKSDLEAHPTVKPVAMVADAIRDVTKRGDLVLDPFLGSGTTLIAAERSGRRCAGIELDPLYVDTAIRRWMKLTGKPVVLAADGRSFDDVASERRAEIAEAAE
jgi:DNA modification methylase